MDTKRIVVVGGGPAGMMAAVRAGQLKRDVTLIEKNPAMGRKLLLSGKGRCNLTNACGPDPFLKRFSKNGQFLRDAFKNFSNTDLMDFFRKRGLKLRTERQLRVFPVTDKANSILEVLRKELRRTRVRIIYGSRLKDILLRDKKVERLALADGTEIPADRLILATGGVSYGFTGSTGEGLDIARSLGHRIVRLRPGLVPLETKQKHPEHLEGLTLKNIRLKFRDGQKRITSEIGEVLFTRFGISGPLVLSLSGRIVEWLDNKKDVYVEIDIKPALSEEKLEARLLREFRSSPGKSIRNVLKNLLPVRMVEVFLDIGKMDHDKKAGQITREDRRTLALLLKRLRLDIKGPGPMEAAMVTRGGVSLKDINPRTMESRIIKGLYFAGEMIDIDADTGGFNLQAAFSTGHLAGESAAMMI